jgi:MFS family permease
MFISTLSSSLPGGSSYYIALYFGIDNPLEQNLVSTFYLVGYVIGPLIFAPMSEHFGRKKLLLSAGGLFFVMSLACIFSPTYTVLLVFRFFAGMGGSAPISVIGGVYADIYPDPRSRGTATAAYTIVSLDGLDCCSMLIVYTGNYCWHGNGSDHLWLCGLHKLADVFRLDHSSGCHCLCGCGIYA